MFRDTLPWKRCGFAPHASVWSWRTAVVKYRFRTQKSTRAREDVSLHVRNTRIHVHMLPWKNAPNTYATRVYKHTLACAWMWPYTHATRLDTPVYMRMCVWCVCRGAGTSVHPCVLVYACCACQGTPARALLHTYVETCCVRVGAQHICTRESVCCVRVGAHLCTRTYIRELRYRFDL